MRGVFLAVIVGLGVSGGTAQAGWFNLYKAYEHEAKGKMQIDWVQYYKMNGYNWPVDAQGNPQRIHFIPAPYLPNHMQWAVPNHFLPGAPPSSYPYGGPLPY